MSKGILIDNYTFLTLDIETSTQEYYDKNNKLVPLAVWLSYGVVTKTNVQSGKTIYRYFRTWDELKKILDLWQWHKAENSKGKYDYRRLCFVHNLSYEFEFLIRNISKPKPNTLIANGTHHVIASQLDNYNIEFRCTYQLANVKLELVGDMVDCPKGESEYRTIYPNDDVTSEEWQYCERDNEIVVKYVQSLLQEYKKLDNLPYTKTGRVRKYYKECYEEFNKEEQWAMLPEDRQFLDLQQKCYYGGITISNPKYTAILVKDKIKSYDIASSYPYAMASEMYPYNMSKRDNVDCTFYIANITINNIKAKYEWCWLPLSKCDSYDEETTIIFNGKIMSSDEITINLTNIDLETLSLAYTFDIKSYNVIYGTDECAALPKCYLETVAHYSEAKVNSKKAYHSDPSNENRIKYNNDKADFNSIYGMTVQKPFTDEFEIDDNMNWIAKIEDKLNHKGARRELKRNFLFGVYITAYARRNLVRGIVYNCPDTFLYADTDSIKFIDTGKPFIDPMKIDGQLHYVDYFKDNPYIKKLGGFDDETEETIITEFKTYGAKKYCYKQGSDYHIVVAGLPKNFQQFQCVGEYLYDVKDNPFTIEDFKLGTDFPHCKLAHKFIYHNVVTDDDGYTEECDAVQQFLQENNINDNGGVALYSVGYQLGMSKNDSNYLWWKYKRMAL